MPKQILRWRAILGKGRRWGGRSAAAWTAVLATDRTRPAVAARAARAARPGINGRAAACCPSCAYRTQINAGRTVSPARRGEHARAAAGAPIDQGLVAADPAIGDRI